jgi:hypothetical protein
MLVRRKRSSRSIGIALPVRRTVHVNIYTWSPLVSSNSFHWLSDGPEKGGRGVYS